MNLYPLKRRGYYCYAIMGNKFLCQRRFRCGVRTQSTFYTLEEAIQWLDSTPNEDSPLPLPVQPTHPFTQSPEAFANDIEKTKAPVYGRGV
jgi:hypothetical protein